MARLVQREFDPARPVYARKYFTAAGRKFVPGDLFDWRKLAVSQRRALQMFDAGKLMHKPEEESAPEPKQEALKSLNQSVEYYEPEVDLDDIDDMKELRRIADEIGAPYKVSKKDQREAIREHRGEA